MQTILIKKNLLSEYISMLHTLYNYNFIDFKFHLWWQKCSTMAHFTRNDI